MPRPNDLFRSRAWLRVGVLAVVGVLAAGCTDSARFHSDSLAFNPDPPRPPAVTGSIPADSPTPTPVASQPLPAPPHYGRSASYRTPSSGGDHARSTRTHVAASASTHRAAPSAGHWTWDHGSAVIVRRGDTLAAIGRRYHVPISGIIRVNHIRNPSAIRVGQRLVIPRYEKRGTSVVGAARPSPAPAGGGNVHVVTAGETLIGIARQHGMSLSALARANKVSPFTRLKIGDRVTIPGGHERKLAEHRRSAPKIAKPQTVPVKTAANARVAKSDVREADNTIKTNHTVESAEPAGPIPSFRWPVRGRIIARFGRQPNGIENDGINLAVPEGTPIKAAGNGVVAYAGNELKGYGNLVLIRHSDGYVSAYADASRLLVKRGDKVKRGQVIARAGQTGNVDSPQLHFEIRKGSIPVNPIKYLGG